jgi:hypothetical protein
LAASIARQFHADTGLHPGARGFRQPEPAETAN